jgi:hypothetical protein
MKKAALQRMKRGKIIAGRESGKCSAFLSVGNGGNGVVGRSA